VKRKKIFCALFAVCAFLFLMGIAGARINTSNSIGVGLYWTSSKTPGKDDYVIFCPPRNSLFDEAFQRGYIKAGHCPGSYGYVMKKIVASKNDIVHVTEEGVYVNGVALPFSSPRRMDAGGNPLKHWSTEDVGYRLADDEFLLMTDSLPESFDARYFGPIKREQIRSVIRPVLTLQHLTTY
jgi:conjugative transfer signal peptidase TraF